jgi:hypothetical protein
MTRKRRHLTSLTRSVCSIVLCVSALPAVALAGDDRDPNDTTLVGTWRESIMFPGVPIEFFDLIAFNADGTLTERFGSVVDGPSITVSIGAWKKIGRGTFAVTMENFSDNNRDGNFDVRFRLRATYHVIDRDTLTATVTGDTLSVDGRTEVGPPFSATIQGTRMRVMPE